MKNSSSQKILKSSAFAPSHITGFFKIYSNGSTGAGLKTDSGAKKELTYNPEHDGKLCKIQINKKTVETPVSNKVVASFSQFFTKGLLQINHYLDYPHGFGMGMSGAGAFSLALALNEVLQSELSYDECMQIAVEAEINSGTGLGDVIAQKYHGLMIGLPPYPSKKVEIIPTDKNDVACIFFEPLNTKSIIRDEKWKERINQVGEECMQELSKNKTAQMLIELSRHFSIETKLASSKVKEVIQAVPGASMAMLGQTIFYLSGSKEEARDALSFYSEKIHFSKLSTTGAKIINV